MFATVQFSSWAGAIFVHRDSVSTSARVIFFTVKFFTEVKFFTVKFFTEVKFFTVG